LEGALGRPTVAEIFDDDEDEWLLEWRCDGFFVTAVTRHGVLIAVGISSISLGGDAPLRLIV